MLSKCKVILSNFAHFYRYDSHLILKEFEPSQHDSRFKLRALPYNTEKMRTISFGHFLLLDSLGFLQASLSELTDNLKASGSNFPILDQVGLAKNDDEKKLLLRKGLYCSFYSQLKFDPCFLFQAFFHTNSPLRWKNWRILDVFRQKRNFSIDSPTRIFLMKTTSTRGKFSKFFAANPC